jgi:hypothetical protein
VPLNNNDMMGVEYESATGRWKNIERPGYFGRQRNVRVADFNQRFGAGSWRLAWAFGKESAFEYAEACTRFYEESYFRWFSARPEAVDEVCSFCECIDNAPTNIASGCDYTIQESYSTHIQDIAVRNVLRRLGRRFEGGEGQVLVIRSADSEGFKFGPGNIPFMDVDQIVSPSKCPGWANKGSVEDFWQSNKFLQVRS